MSEIYLLRTVSGRSVHAKREGQYPVITECGLRQSVSFGVTRLYSAIGDRQLTCMRCANSIVSRKTANQDDK